MPAKNKPLIDLKIEFLKRNLSIATVAERCGVSRGHLSRVINGRVEMDDKLARDIAMATGIPKREILGEREAEATAV